MTGSQTLRAGNATALAAANVLATSTGTFGCPLAAIQAMRLA